MIDNLTTAALLGAVLAQCGVWIKGSIGGAAVVIGLAITLVALFFSLIK